jgi:anti-anti-sigma factor
VSNYFKVEKNGKVDVISFLFSELSIDSAEAVKNDLYSLISEENKFFVINMGQSNFLPSIALGIVVCFNKKILTKNGRVAFCCLMDQVKTLFRITRLDEIFDVYDSVQDAVDSFTV